MCCITSSRRKMERLLMDTWQLLFVSSCSQFSMEWVTVCHRNGIRLARMIATMFLVNYIRRAHISCYALTIGRPIGSFQTRSQPFITTPKNGRLILLLSSNRRSSLILHHPQHLILTWSIHSQHHLHHLSLQTLYQCHHSPQLHFYHHHWSHQHLSQPSSM